MKFGSIVLAATIIMGSAGSITSVQAKDIVIDVKKVAADVKALVKNRAKLSCIELSLASLQATQLNVIAASKSVKASSATRKLARSVGKSASAAIAKEEQCHCDRGAAMPGYEIFERRLHLQKSKRNKRINRTLINFYPKDATGKPRFLRIGEPLDDRILAQLPPPIANKRFDDCGRSCKRARKRTNAAAVAAGKPEPFPNLEYPRKKACR